jgi:hypothetical protein
MHAPTASQERFSIAQRQLLVILVASGKPQQAWLAVAWAVCSAQADFYRVLGLSRAVARGRTLTMITRLVPHFRRVLACAQEKAMGMSERTSGRHALSPLLEKWLRLQCVVLRACREANIRPAHGMALRLGTGRLPPAYLVLYLLRLSIPTSPPPPIRNPSMQISSSRPIAARVPVPRGLGCPAESPLLWSTALQHQHQARIDDPRSAQTSLHHDPTISLPWIGTRRRQPP